MKYLLCDNEQIARQKANAAVERKWPNRHTLQAEAHLRNPSVYRSPYITDAHLDTLGDIFVDPATGKAEIEIFDDDTQHYPDDVNDIRNTNAVNHAQGPK